MPSVVRTHECNGAIVVVRMYLSLLGSDSIHCSRSDCVRLMNLTFLTDMGSVEDPSKRAFHCTRVVDLHACSCTRLVHDAAPLHTRRLGACRGVIITALSKLRWSWG